MLGRYSPEAVLSLATIYRNEMAAVQPALPSDFTCGKCQILQGVEFEYFDVECCHVCYACLKQQTHCPVCGRELTAEEREMITIYNEAYYDQDPVPPDDLEV